MVHKLLSGILPLVLIFGTVFAGFVERAGAGEAGGEQPATMPAPAADTLVQAAKDGEQWIHRVDSFFVRFDGVWTKTPESIARRRAQRKREFPGDDLDIKRWPEFLPRDPDTLVFAFDRRRLYERDERPSSDLGVRFWDGSRAVTHVKYFSHDQEQYSFGPTPEGLGDYFFASVSWLRAGNHAWWWAPRLENPRPDSFDPEGRWTWKVAGREKYRGTDCWVLEAESGWTRWYVGVERPLVHGIITYVVSGDLDAEYNTAAVEAARKLNEPGINTSEALMKRAAALPKERQREAMGVFARELLTFAHPMVEYMLSDYQEVAPGCWFPMSQGYDLYDDEQSPPILGTSRRLKAIEVKVNQPLPDDLFQMEFAEGVEVYDTTHEPPLSYKYKKSFTAAEWKAIVDRAAAQEAMQRQIARAQNALVGKPAPEFPATCQWINVAGERPTLKTLKGKAVVIDFFADWCGPCRNDLPTMSRLHKEGDKLPFRVMAIHPPGSPRASIDQVIKDFDLGYPICIDIPHPGSWGELFSAYGVKAIPHAVVIDKEGTIAGQGSLEEMLGKAYELSR